MGISKSLDRLVNILTIINSNRPVLKPFYGIFRGAAHGGISVCFLDDGCSVRCVTGLVSKIIQRDDRAFERNFGGIMCANLIQSCVRLGDCIFYRSFDRFRRLFPLGDC